MSSIIIPGTALCVPPADIYPGVPMGARDTQNTPYTYPPGNASAATFGFQSMAMPTAGQIRNMYMAVLASTITGGNNIARAFISSTYGGTASPTDLSVCFPPSAPALILADNQTLINFTQGQYLDFSHTTTFTEVGQALFRTMSFEYGNPEGSCLIPTIIKSAIGSGTTYWNVGGYAQDYNQKGLLFPFAGTLDRMYVTIAGTQPGGGNLTVQVGGLSVTIPAGSPAGSYPSSGSIPITANEILTMTLSQTSGSSAVVISVSMRLTASSGIRGLLIADDNFEPAYSTLRNWGVFGQPIDPTAFAQNDYIFVMPCQGIIRNLWALAYLDAVANLPGCHNVASYTLYQNGSATALSAAQSATGHVVPSEAWVNVANSCIPGSPVDIPVSQGDIIWVAVQPASSCSLFGSGRVVMEFQRTV